MVETHGWIPITDKYPPFNDYSNYLVLRKDGECFVAYWVFDDGWIGFPGDDSGWRICIDYAYGENNELIDNTHLNLKDIIYWRPLPKKPEYILNKEVLDDKKEVL